MSGVPAVHDDRRVQRAQVREIWKVKQTGLGVAEEWGRDWKRRASKDSDQGDQVDTGIEPSATKRCSHKLQ